MSSWRIASATEVLTDKRRPVPSDLKLMHYIRDAASEAPCRAAEDCHKDKCWTSRLEDVTCSHCLAHLQVALERNNRKQIRRRPIKVDVALD